jgi:hypothetical protein
MQEKLKSLLETVTSAQILANSPELVELPSLNDARTLLQKAIHVIGNYSRSAEGINTAAVVYQGDDETTLKIRAAQKHIIFLSNGTKSIGGKVFRGDVPEKPLLEYYHRYLAKGSDEVVAQPDAVAQVQEQDSEAAKVPTTGTPNVEVKDEADYQAKKDMLANCSEDFKTSDAFRAISEAVKAYELATGADVAKVSRREEMQALLPALDITDEEIAEIDEYAKTVSVDSIKKKYSQDQINAVLIMLYNANTVDSRLGAARTLHTIHNPEKA